MKTQHATKEQAEKLYVEVKELRDAYLHTFRSTAGQAVLKDLMKFCRAQESCAVLGDHDRTFMLMGRNEVWLRIHDTLNYTPADLITIRSGGNIRVIEEKEEDDG